MMKINFLDYLCSNRDRYSTNFFVWKDGLCGIDNEFALFTGTNWKKEAYALCIEEDLPNLIPYATQELYNIAQSFLKDDGLEELINIYMIFVKTLNEKNLLQGTKNIRQRAKELLDHFEWLQSNDRILQHVNSFNAKTAMDITTQSLNLNSAKQILTYDRLATLTGTAFMGYTVDIIQKIEEKNPKQKEQLNLPIVSEENENVEDDKNSFF